MLSTDAPSDQVRRPQDASPAAPIGAFSIVARDVPPYAIVMGNPAEVRRYRFDVDVISALQSIAWWNWEPEVVAARADDLCSPDVAGFVSKYR